MANTYVLVHGAFTGGWVWRDVRNALLDRGHRVFTPTLTGLGERAHLARQDVTFETHVKDLREVFELEDLTDVILVGHSSSGNLIAVLADQIPERIRHLIFLDSAVPEPNTMTVSVPPQAMENLIDGFLAPPPPIMAQGVFPDHPAAEWFSARRRPLPITAYDATVPLTGAWTKLNRLFIQCTVGPLPHAREAAERALDQGMALKGIGATHAAMVTAPDLLVQALTELD